MLFLFSGLYLFLQVHFTSLQTNVKLRHYLCIGWGELNFSYSIFPFFKERPIVKKHSTVEYRMGTQKRVAEVELYRHLQNSTLWLQTLADFNRR